VTQTGLKGKFRKSAEEEMDQDSTDWTASTSTPGKRNLRSSSIKRAREEYKESEDPLKTLVKKARPGGKTELSRILDEIKELSKKMSRTEENTKCYNKRLEENIGVTTTNTKSITDLGPDPENQGRDQCHAQDSCRQDGGGHGWSSSIDQVRIHGVRRTGPSETSKAKWLNSGVHYRLQTKARRDQLQGGRIEESENRGWRLPQGCLRIPSLSWIKDPNHDPLEHRQAHLQGTLSTGLPCIERLSNKHAMLEYKLFS